MQAAPQLDRFVPDLRKLAPRRNSTLVLNQFRMTDRAKSRQSKQRAMSTMGKPADDSASKNKPLQPQWNIGNTMPLSALSRDHNAEESTKYLMHLVS